MLSARSLRDSRVCVRVEATRQTRSSSRGIPVSRLRHRARRSAWLNSRSVSRGLALAQRIRSGMVHVNDQTVNDEAVIPFGGMGASGNGSRFGGQANLDEFTEWQWVTVRDDPKSFPFPY